MQHSYVLLHKPYNVLCQFTDNSPQGSQRQTLKDFVPVPDIYSAGRLDLDSEGLLLLTNDAPLKHYLCEPKFAHPRTYWVQVENIPDGQALEQLRQGVMVQGKKTRPAIANLLTPEPTIPAREPPIRFRKNVPTAWLELTLTEGRNRQVRRMTAAVGHPTLRLMRVAIGTGPAKLTLTGLGPGEWRHLTTAEIGALQNLVKKAKPNQRSPHKKTASRKPKGKRR
ncbi:pseudouridine synthase [Picosynechococcus sp. PCC 73109]|uniref:pseudouridine synthase n=1 Tax=Picosynechococcus sp. PCC 73109 TaxID=374982 RepID=UPI0007459352|nr:pseudouridine synthase [Picosynechococcus sp. PCC 73109]AMA09959.1 pseudouridine synthase [Picosynechococcus sp. PCC 73109]